MTRPRALTQPRRGGERAALFLGSLLVSAMGAGCWARATDDPAPVGSASIGGRLGSGGSINAGGVPTANGDGGGGGAGADGSGASGGTVGGPVALALGSVVSCNGMERQVTGTSCKLSATQPARVIAWAEGPSEPFNYIVSIAYGDTTPGVRTTEGVYDGDAVALACGVSNVTSRNDAPGLGERDPSALSGPCTVELVELRRGPGATDEVPLDGALEPGSYVKMRASCPRVLFTPFDGSDAPGEPLPIAPNEFVMEASDCTWWG